MSAQPKTTTCLPFMTMASNRDLCARTLAQGKLPVVNRISPGHIDPTSNKIKVMTMKVNKGLGFPMVALHGLGHMPATEEDEKKSARVFLCGGYEGDAEPFYYDEHRTGLWSESEIKVMDECLSHKKFLTTRRKKFKLNFLKIRANMARHKN